MPCQNFIMMHSRERASFHLLNSNCGLLVSYIQHISSPRPTHDRPTPNMPIGIPIHSLRVCLSNDSSPIPPPETIGAGKTRLQSGVDVAPTVGARLTHVANKSHTIPLCMRSIQQRPIDPQPHTQFIITVHIFIFASPIPQPAGPICIGIRAFGNMASNATTNGTSTPVPADAGASSGGPHPRKLKILMLHGSSCALCPKPTTHIPSPLLTLAPNRIHAIRPPLPRQNPRSRKIPPKSLPRP
jgi:hypothetical protein